jgi:multidrug efflux pump
MLTLFTTPVVYLYMDRLSLWWHRVHGGEMRPAAQPSD